MMCLSGWALLMFDSDTVVQWNPKLFFFFFPLSPFFSPSLSSILLILLWSLILLVSNEVIKIDKNMWFFLCLFLRNVSGTKESLLLISCRRRFNFSFLSQIFKTHHVILIYCHFWHLMHYLISYLIDSFKQKSCDPLKKRGKWKLLWSSLSLWDIHQSLFPYFQIQDNRSSSFFFCNLRIHNISGEASYINSASLSDKQGRGILKENIPLKQVALSLLTSEGRCGSYSAAGDKR